MKDTSNLYSHLAFAYFIYSFILLLKHNVTKIKSIKFSFNYCLC